MAIIHYLTCLFFGREFIGLSLLCNSVTIARYLAAPQRNNVQIIRYLYSF